MAGTRLCEAGDMVPVTEISVFLPKGRNIVFLRQLCNFQAIRAAILTIQILLKEELLG